MERQGIKRKCEGRNRDKSDPIFVETVLSTTDSSGIGMPMLFSDKGIRDER